MIGVEASEFEMEEDLNEVAHDELHRTKKLIATAVTAGTSLTASFREGQLQLDEFKVTPFKKHWKEIQSDKDKNDALVKAQIKRDRKLKKKQDAGK